MKYVKDVLVTVLFFVFRVGGVHGLGELAQMVLSDLGLVRSIVLADWLLAVEFTPLVVIALARVKSRRLRDTIVISRLGRVVDGCLVLLREAAVV